MPQNLGTVQGTGATLLLERQPCMADEATTTKWTVKHEPVNEDHESQRDASN